MLSLLSLLTALAQDTPSDEDIPKDDTASEDSAPDTAAEDSAPDTAAEDSAPDTAAEDSAPDTAAESAELPAFDPATVQTEALGGLTDEQHAFLEPRLGRLPPHPYAQTDFTAYTLEWGEVKLGLASLTVGVLPRTELGTSVVLDALNIPNAAMKINVLRLGPLDMALRGSYYAMPLETFTGSRSSLGTRASLILLDGWSLHTSASYDILLGDGLPDLSAISGVLEWLTGADIDDYSVQALQEQYDLHINARTLSLSLATDIRLNRRDSFVLQGSANVYSRLFTAVSGGEIPPIFNLEEILDQDREGSVPITDSYIASVAYQAAWKRLELRLGIGTSATPGLWLMQSTELSYRLGGRTRRTEREVYRAWERNEEEVEKQ